MDGENNGNTHMNIELFLLFEVTHNDSLSIFFCDTCVFFQQR